MKKENGVNKLTESQEQMRMDVVEAELKARFWKAQYDIRHYTLEAEKIQPEYDKYIDEQRKKNDELQKMYQEKIDELSKAGLTVQEMSEGKEVEPTTE